MKLSCDWDLFFIFLLLDICIHTSQGDCNHNGRTYMKHTVWQPGPCTVCTCEDPIVLCETIRCTDPQCQYDKGEYLQISADSCCPECLPQLAACTYQDKTLQHNTEWNPEPCITCICIDGEVTCTKVPCLHTRCQQGEVTQNVPGQCCPQCIPAGKACTYNGEQYLDGSDWETLPCTKCVCRDGQHKCYPLDCPLVVCAEHEVLETVPGSCCPACHGHNTTCREAGVQYKTGEQWHRNPCTLCVCIGGTVVCTVKECMELMICNQNEIQETRPGECCPECLPKTGICKDVEPVKYSGDIWNTSNCEYCMCKEGVMQCHTAICEKIVCFKEEVLVHLPGTCCPQCIIPPTCQSAGRTYQDGERWSPDACSLCYCDGGMTTCYTKHCPACPRGSVSISAPGECCGTCRKVECSPECSDCQPNSPDNCTICTNTQLYVQHGRCLHTCRMGFYPSPSRVCLPCDDTCYTCRKGTPYHCDMCQPGLMWKHGECVPQCGMGYYLQNGKCKECMPSCKTCNGPKVDQCTSCSNSAQVVFRGECRDQCPNNFFIRAGKCIACHPTCKTCTPDGSGCASCWEGGLLHLGQCVTRCSIGYYANNVGSCSPCHPGCESCTGGNSRNCTSCHAGGRISKKGRCRSMCEKGQYLAIDGTCTACDGGCSECHESWSGGITKCSACDSKNQVPTGSACVDECRSRQFIEYRACKDCGDNCMTCTSPTSCSRCIPSMLLYNGLCVSHCDQGQYEHGPSLSCKDCSSDCLKCYSEEECRVCNSDTYLKQGYCVAECGEGYLANLDTRECKRNVVAPTFKVLHHVQVEDSGISPLTPRMFYISDTDTTSDNLLITMVTAPDNGDLVRAHEGQDVVVGVGDNFRISDIVEGKVRFLHKSGQGEKGKATLHVSDSQLTSESGDLYFQVVTSTAITIATRTNILATRSGEITPILPNIFNLNTEAAADHIRITVIQGPREGSIYDNRLRSDVHSFSLGDLQGGVIGYKHTKEGTTTSDNVLLQATDGFNVLTVILNIEIRPTESHGPILMHNKVGHVILGDMLQISPDLLLAKVVEEEGIETEEVVYTLTPPLNNPSEGEIIMRVPIPASGVGYGWENLGDGNMAARMSRFLQRDIDEGRIWYKNKGTASFTDMVKFEVADTSSPANILTDQSFMISVVKKTTVGPTTHPTVAPGVRLCITVLEDQLLAITTANLEFLDQDTDPDQILFSITRPLGLQDGRVEHIEQPFHPVRTFTQEDIDNNRVIYRPPDHEIGPREKEVFFYFTVSDGEDETRPVEHKFSIRLIPVNDKPPRFTLPIPMMHVSQGGSSSIGQSVLEVIDEDTPLGDLTVTLTREPHNGHLEKSEDGLKATLRQGDVFTYTELTKNVFKYHHDGSTGLFDTMQFAVTDGDHTTTASVDVTIMRVDKSSPYMLPSATCRLVVTEGTSEVIDRDILAFVDNEDSDVQLRIQLVMETTHGKLLLSNQQVMYGDVFTQADINDGHLSFLADSEIGDTPVTEVLLFNVTDSSSNTLPGQTLTVLIEPANNQPPRVKVTKGVKVNEGGQVTLTPTDIKVTDPDSIVNDLVVVIETQPSFGIIKDIAPVEGSERLEDRLVSSFPVEDLVNGYIIYIQSDHKDKEPVKDNFLFHITDGVNRSPTYRFNVTIVPENDESPSMVTEQVFVQEGQTVVLSNASVYVTDLDTPASRLVFTLHIPPSHGGLKKKISRQQTLQEAGKLSKDSEFTYQDVLSELIHYSHDGTEESMDSFSLHLTDGRFKVTGRLSVIIGLVNDEVPRVTINTGLRVQAGSTTLIKSEDLSCTDVDSDYKKLIYTVTKDPKIGALYVNIRGRPTKISSKGTVRTFTQTDIDNGNVEYKHTRGETTGNIMFQFTVSDPEGNDLIDQDFYITILEDRYPPQELCNKELLVEEGGRMIITTDFLSFTDQDSQTANLQYILITAPQLGHLELVPQHDIPISEFSQSDLAANNVIYIHTSDKEIHMDSFTFSVSDGTNEVIRTFNINLSPVDDSIPMVTSHGLRAQEGVRKIISEFDLKAVDVDTMEDSVIFSIVQSPIHGSIEHLVDTEWTATSSFTMTEIYDEHVSYMHDGSKTRADNFKYTVTDGSTSQFAMETEEGNGQSIVPGSQAQTFVIEIVTVDDGSPVIVTNHGLKFLDVSSTGVSNVITSRELQTSDEDTQPNRLKFVVRLAPTCGRLERTDRPGEVLTTFTQADINNGIVKYILTDHAGESYQDSFTFDLYDSKPNRIPGNMFHITWSIVEFDTPLMNVTETAGVIRVPVKRKGNLKQYSIVTCRTTSGTATSSEQGSRPGQQDYVQHVGQVQFDEWQETKTCTIIINDDSIFEGPETFYVELLEPTYTLLGKVAKTTVTIMDLEDEPVLQFEESLYHINESNSYLSASIVRSGDISSTVSTICFTTTLTARGSPLDRLDSGSDYISRGNSNSYRVVFPSGVTIATCDVKLIDDSLHEASEQFQLELSLPSYGAKLGPVSRATVVIDGPNDESQIFLSQSVYDFDENAGTVDIEITREGTDLSHSSTVWCATRLSIPPSAASGQDYIPSSSQITFGPGQTTQRCQLTILDDDLEPRVEVNETFTVFLSSAISSNLVQPYQATVVIHDAHLDVPTMSFRHDSYTINEGEGHVTVPIYRSGDVSFPSSVICYTRQDRAFVALDFVERIMAEQSRIMFTSGEKVKNCTVTVLDDDKYETDEIFYLKLDRAQGTSDCEARIGDINSTQITITNTEDVPTIQFEKSAYSIPEPSSKDQISKVTVKVVRSGDVTMAASVRCSTRDGSAMSGTDYNPRSLVLQFPQGVRTVDFPVDILYNSDIEWHETFRLVLETPGVGVAVGTGLGSVAMTTITILDNDVSGSLVLPTPPVVVSLLHYDDAEDGTRVDPTPGYPLVCITPCDIKHPSYPVTHKLCEESKVNQSAIYYRWEVSMPDGGGSRPPFVEVSYNTLFTSVNTMVLDSIYFRPSFKVRCIAQPIDEKGNPGIPLKSKAVVIGRDNGICKAPVFSGLPYSYQAQSFLAKLNYVGTEDAHHPNTIHISIEVPHQDGMLPLISTFPINNLKFLLSEPVYRQQHVCSNIITPSERAPLLDSGFLESGSFLSKSASPGYDYPFQFDTNMRENKTLLLYQHLNLKTCVWTFDAWYHMTDLVDLCGGRAISDFQVSEGGQTYLTVRVPLYVSYVFATAPVGWGSLEHRTEMEFSFYYNTVLWRSGLETEGNLGGKLQVMRILIDDEGKLVIDFKTQAKFRGVYVLKHHTLPGYISRVVSMDKIISFDLDLLWGQNTFDGPHQLWRATSDYSLKDYTGEYTVELIACTVQPNQGYTIQTPLPCTGHQPQRFDVPIAFQQTNRPVSMEYTLNTHFQLSNNERMFLANPFTSDIHMEDMDSNAAFSKGERIFGRVLWSPEQDLKEAYSLSIEKVFLCTGSNGFIPTYDPTGRFYNNGPQFGCIQPGPNLRYRFLILDRGAPDVTTKKFQNIPFEAQLASDNPLYASLLSINGVDGFVISVDPLYKVTSGYQWYLQVIYTIGPSDPNLQQYRNKRSTLLSLDKHKRSLALNINGDSDRLDNNSSKNGTNIKVLHLNHTQVLHNFEEHKNINLTSIIVPIIIALIVLLCTLILFFIYRKRKRRHKQKPPVMKNNLQLAKQNSRIYKGNQNNIVRVGSALELKESKVVYKGDHVKPSVRVKDTNIQTDKNISKGNGTEV